MLMTLKHGMQHQVLKYYQSCSNDDPGLTMTYFTARSNLIPFVWEKGKTVDFYSRCSQLNAYMNLYEYQRSRSFIDLCPRSFRFNIFKLVFLKKTIGRLKRNFMG